MEATRAAAAVVGPTKTKTLLQAELAVKKAAALVERLEKGAEAARQSADGHGKRKQEAMAAKLHQLEDEARRIAAVAASAPGGQTADSHQETVTRLRIQLKQFKAAEKAASQSAKAQARAEVDRAQALLEATQKEAEFAVASQNAEAQVQAQLHRTAQARHDLLAVQQKVGVEETLLFHAP